MPASAVDASLPEPDPNQLQCGPDTCRPSDAGAPCCVDRFAGGCGIMSDSECKRLPKRDDRCVAWATDGTMGAEAEAAGIVPCCAANGECGVDLGAGLGCLATSAACMFISRDLLPKIDATTCDGEPVELPADCGI